ncbi:MAG: histone deacetylase [Nitrospinae bacterium CG11_big_fil_rev_8_21_14_0_20_56_8]|nr:MAG: histone deacetylase [Nitrospinae bacterium CG11_big_fil_rev_8_21_14_0_20_56_8]
MNRTGYIYNPFYLRHKTDPHPENPGRLQAIESGIRASGLAKSLVFIEPRHADAAEIALNHDPDYVTDLRRSCEMGMHSLEADTVICPDSYTAALLSAGAGLTAVDQVLDGACDNVFCAVRPPGHHAEFGRAMGFCLFNNVAIAARYALRKRGLNRIFIFDWDVHHGNGTQNSFYTTPSVYYSSAHQYPFYPGTGAEDERGSGDGLNTNLNFPLRAFCGDDVYLDLVENRLIPEIQRFKPELILLSAGFDAHEDDPLAQMNVSTEGFAKMTELLVRAARDVCGGRLVSMLEGGYNHEALRDSVCQHLKTLQTA